MIKIEHLQKTYNSVNGSLTVLKDVNAEINQGEVISIIGPSGTGKSTFLRCINRLETPTSGHIWFDGVDLTDPKTDLTAARRKMGMVFQNFNLFNHLSVLDNLMVGPIQLLGVSPQEAEERGRKLLLQVGLAAKADAFPHELSGGQKQRVAIARCLSMQPEVILFDEPTSALDPTMVTEVLSVIRDVAKQGITMLIVTHEMKFARQVSTRIFYMNQGVIYEDGSPEQVFDSPQKSLTKIFINRIHSCECHLEDSTADFYHFYSEIEQFCIHYGLSITLINRTLHLVEEAMEMCFSVNKEKRDDILRQSGGLDVKVMYSEKTNQIKIYFMASKEIGSILNIDAETDAISWSILQGYTSKIDEREKEGRLRLKMWVKG